MSKRKRAVIEIIDSDDESPKKKINDIIEILDEEDTPKANRILDTIDESVDDILEITNVLQVHNTVRYPPKMRRPRAPMNPKVPKPKVYVEQRFNQFYCVYASWANKMQTYMSYKDFEGLVIRILKKTHPKTWEYELSQEKIGDGWCTSVKWLLLNYFKIPFKVFSMRKDPEGTRHIMNGILDIVSVNSKPEGGHYHHSVAIVNGWIVDSLTGYKPQVFYWDGGKMQNCNSYIVGGVEF